MQHLMKLRKDTVGVIMIMNLLSRRTAESTGRFFGGMERSIGNETLLIRLPQQWSFSRLNRNSVNSGNWICH